MFFHNYILPKSFCKVIYSKNYKNSYDFFFTFAALWQIGSSGQHYFFEILLTVVKFIYSEKATKFCEIFTLLLTGTTKDKGKVKISQNFVAFTEYMTKTKTKMLIQISYLY